MTSDQDLIEGARSWGYSVSPRQLERWRNDGLLPPLAVRGRGRGRGQERYYHTDPTEQIRKLLDLRKSGVSGAESAIRLWLAGYPIDLNDVRRHLPRALKSVHRFRKHLGSPAFAERFAEYLHRTPRAREAWFGDRFWNQERYDLSVKAAAALAQNDGAQSRDGQETLRRFAGRMTNLDENERGLILALGGDPDALMDQIPSTFQSIFARLEDATNDELLKARAIQQSMLELAEVSGRIAALMPNPVSSLLGKVSQHDDLHTSYGFFVGFGTLVLAGESDILMNIQMLRDQLTQVLRNLSAEHQV